MIKKILWATDGSEDSFAALKNAELVAKNCNADIYGLAVIPDDSAMLDKFPSEENQIVEAFKLKYEEILEQSKKELAKNNINFSYSISKGQASKEITKMAERKNIDLIALGRGRSVYNFILGGTVIRVLRNCTIPILTARENSFRSTIKKILVPVDLSHGITVNLNYAHILSKAFGAEIHLANIIETSEHNFSPDLVERIKSNTTKEIGYLLSKSSMAQDVRVEVEAAKNAWIGITNLAKENDIDLIVMMTYEGIVVKKEFIGSTTWKVVQEASVPVITLTPDKVIMKMTGDAK